MPGARRLISLAVSLALLAAIYWKVDVARLADAFHASDPLWMAASLGMALPLTMLTAWRLRQLAPRSVGLGFGEANRLILAASALNMVLPSKLGDIAKAYFLRDRGGLGTSFSLSLVVFEKTCDMLSLLAWCALGLVLFPQRDSLFTGLAAAVGIGFVAGALLIGSRRFARFAFAAARTVAGGGFGRKVARLETSWLEMHGHFWRDPGKLARVAALSLLIWFLHLLQIWMFTVALRAAVPFVANLALAPLAILAGLLPLTFAGVGTRDAAIIALYRPYLAPATGAAVGLLCTARYVLPAVAGLPFLGRYLEAGRPRGAVRDVGPP